MSNLYPPLLIFIAGPQAGQQVSLNQLELIIGRKTGVDLVVNAPLISRRAAASTNKTNVISSRIWAAAMAPTIPGPM
jgi:hypothetical protein